MTSDVREFIICSATVAGIVIIIGSFMAFWSDLEENLHVENCIKAKQAQLDLKECK